MVDYLITPASGTAAISDSSGVSTSPGANKLWASGTNLFWGTTQVDGGGGGGTIGGSITDNQVAIGATTADSIEGSANLTYDGTNLVLARTADATSRGISIMDNEGTETIRLATASGDQGLLYLKGPTGGNAIYLDGNGDSYFDSGDVGIGTTSPSYKLHVVGDILATSNINVGAGAGYALESYSNNQRYGLKYGAAGTVDGSDILMLTNREGDGDIQIATSSGDTGGAGEETTRMTVKHTTGYVGIGTDTPATKLDVVGSITAGTDSYTTISNNEYDVSSGDLLIDVAGDISLDAAGNEIRFKYGGTEIGRFANSSSDFVISSIQDNKDIIFKGYDNLSYIQAAHFDMSDVGHLHLGGQLTVSGAANVTGTATFKGDVIAAAQVDVSGASAALELKQADGGTRTVGGGTLTVSGASRTVNQATTVTSVGQPGGSENITAAAGQHYVAYADIGTLTYTLPADPLVGDMYTITYTVINTLLGNSGTVKISSPGSDRINNTTSTITIKEAVDTTNGDYGRAVCTCVANPGTVLPVAYWVLTIVEAS